MEDSCYIEKMFYKLIMYNNFFIYISNPFLLSWKLSINAVIYQRNLYINLLINKSIHSNFLRIIFYG